MNRRRTLIAKTLLALGAAGVLAGVAGMVVGLRAITALDAAVVDSTALTAEALGALDESVTVAQDTLVTLEDTVGSTETTTREVVAAFEEGEELLEATADLSEQEIAPTIAAVEDALPGLIEAAAVVDQTLVALSQLPFGPVYEPDEPFDESLRSLQAELDGLPDHVREQAELIRETGASMGTVREGSDEVADDLAALHVRLESAAALLEGYAATAGDAQALVADSQAALDTHLAAARVMVVVLGLLFAAGQLVPLLAGWLLLNPQRLTALLDADG